MEKRELTCICCPLGCALTVEMEGGEVKGVTGNGCKRGAEYGPKEVTSPTRIVTSSVCVTGGTDSVVSVKTASEKYGVTPRWVQKLCIDGKIEGAKRLEGSGIWLIPKEANIVLERKRRNDKAELFFKESERIPEK